MMSEGPLQHVRKLLEALNEAPTCGQAALVTVRLYTTLAPLRDATFRAEWNQLLEGHFADLAGTRSEWRFIRWNHVFKAQEILMRLLHRRGLLDFGLSRFDAGVKRGA